MKQSIFFDSKLKKLTSIRDGVHEYFGAELDIEPADKVFKVFRSAKSVKDCAKKMGDLIITNDHISTDESATPHKIGLAITPNIENVADPSTDTTIAVIHKASIQDKLLSLVDAGKKQLSLGYKGKLIEHDKYDFEQINITPHHLALVDAGRCGSICTFNDKGGKMADRDVNILADKVADLAADGGKPFADALADLVKFKKEKEGKEGKKETKDMDKDDDETVPPKKKVETKDMDMEAQKKKEMEDEEKKKEGEGGKPKKGVIPDNFKDSIEFKDAVLNMAKAMSLKHVAVVEKARGFLPSNYSFSDNLPCRIQRDALKTQISDDFADSELDAAFKMLTHNKDYSNFGDSKPDDLISLADKEL